MKEYTVSTAMLFNTLTGFDKRAYVMEQGDPQIYIKNMKEHTYLIEFDYTIQADAAIVQEKAASVKGWEKLKGMIQHAK